MSGPWTKYQAGPWQKYGANDAFDTHVQGVLKREGGYVNDPEDRGGETKYGISKKANPDVEIATLTESDAKRIYRERYWDAIGASSLPPALQGMAFDAAVNQGVAWTKRALARAGGDARRFLDLRAKRYAAIVRGDPSQKKFASGWEKRLNEFDGPWLRHRGKE